MFNGYLIKFGNYTIPLKYIQEKTYSAKVNTLDLDPFNDADGILNREVIQRIPKVTFTTMPLKESDWNTIMSNLENQYDVAEERKANCIVYVPEWRNYKSMDMYISDMDIVIDEIIDGVVYFEPIQLTLTGYGE